MLLCPRFGPLPTMTANKSDERSLQQLTVRLGHLFPSCVSDLSWPIYHTVFNGQIILTSPCLYSASLADENFISFLVVLT